MLKKTQVGGVSYSGTAYSHPLSSSGPSVAYDYRLRGGITVLAVPEKCHVLSPKNILRRTALGVAFGLASRSSAFVQPRLGNQTDHSPRERTISEHRDMSYRSALAVDPGFNSGFDAIGADSRPPQVARLLLQLL